MSNIPTTLEEIIALGQRAGMTAAIAEHVQDSTLASNLTETIGDTVIQNLAVATETKIAEAKKYIPLAAHICCTAICCSVFVVIVIAAYITAFVGLAHTQNVDLDPMCPTNFWDGQITLLFLRLIAFILMICTLCAVGFYQRIFCTSALIVCTLITVLSFAITDTVVTAQAWYALNCSIAVRASRDADPLLMASGSLFIMIDWLMLICACSAACRTCRARAEVETAE